MRRELIATLGGAEKTLTVEAQDGDLWRVVIDGTEHLVDAREVRPGTWSVIIDGRAHLVDLDARKLGTTALAGGTETPVEVEDARRKRLAAAVSSREGATGRGGVVRAPIAGKVVKILVGAGDEVTSGQPVAVLEAMKMENEILAERAGTVDSVHAAPEQSVEAGEKLLTLA